MKYKDGVIVSMTKMIGNLPVHLSASEKCMNAMMIADELSMKIAGKEVVITSLLDGVHSKNSLHYTGNAFDLRVWIYTEKQRKTLLIQLRKTLGIDYDVVDEVDHLHIEWDPL